MLDTDSSVVTAADPVTDAAAGLARCELGDAEFTYPGADSPVLRDISFTAEPGQTTAIIGSTGAGKTTLVSLIPRLFDATGGPVLVDGVDVRDLDPELLWSRIGLVPQKPFLFTGTVASATSATASPTRPTTSCGRRCGSPRPRTSSAPCPGSSTPRSAQGGTNVSGGQRQRLSIARALVKKPEIYVFDDSFSALDVATDARLRAALKAETTDACVIIVGQRVATIADADKILVLEDGAIVGQRHPRRAAGDLSDLRGDRRLPAERRGGGGMSDGRATTASRKCGRAAEVRRPAGQRGGGRMFGGPACGGEVA